MLPAEGEEGEERGDDTTHSASGQNGQNGQHHDVGGWEGGAVDDIIDPTWAQVQMDASRTSNHLDAQEMEGGVLTGATGATGATGPSEAEWAYLELADQCRDPETFAKWFDPVRSDPVKSTVQSVQDDTEGNADSDDSGGETKGTGVSWEEDEEEEEEAFAEGQFDDAEEDPSHPSHSSHSSHSPPSGPSAPSAPSSTSSTHPTPAELVAKLVEHTKDVDPRDMPAVSSDSMNMSDMYDSGRNSIILLDP